MLVTIIGAVTIVVMIALLAGLVWFAATTMGAGRPVTRLGTQVAAARAHARPDPGGEAPGHGSHERAA